MNYDKLYNDAYLADRLETGPDLPVKKSNETISNMKICRECQVLGKRSIISVGSTTCTLMSTYHYFDEEGREHFHDPNTISTRYYCSNGHAWKEDIRHLCWCENKADI